MQGAGEMVGGERESIFISACETKRGAEGELCVCVCVFSRVIILIA